MAGLVGSPEVFESLTDEWRIYTQRFDYLQALQAIRNLTRSPIISIDGKCYFQTVGNSSDMTPNKPGEL